MTERWTDERIDRLAEAVIGITGNVNNLTDVVEQNTRSINRLEASVESLVNVSHAVITELQRQGVEIREMQAEVRAISVEVRGLQTENRRILDRMFGEQSN